MEKKNIKLNYIYNLAYQILLLATPLITAPYISRVLGANGIGTYSFTNSIVSYFALFAAMGTAIYGQREVSYAQDNKERRSKVFWDTEVLSFISTVICVIFYFIFMVGQKNRGIYLVLSLNIVAVATDITWLFQGMEEFGKIVFRNFIFKILNIIFVFAFVKMESDLIIYIFGMSFLTCLSNISLWFYLPKYVNKPIRKELRPFGNIKVVISLFIPTIAMQVYTVLDKTMIGWFTQNPLENGYYEQALKLSKMVLMLVVSLGTVMIPRIGYYFERKEIDIVNRLIFRSYTFVWFLGIPLCLGLIGISRNFVPWFYGQGFDKVAPLLGILGFLVLAIGINNVTGMQYLIPTKRQNVFSVTVLVGAVVNFVLNLLLIPQLQSIGAAIASVAAETTIALVQLFTVRKEFSIWKVFRCSWHYWMAGGIMLIVVTLENRCLVPSIINTCIMIVSGAFVYFIVLLIYRDEFLVINIKKIIDKLRLKMNG